MAKEYGWTPDQVNQLTSYQMRMYLSGDDDVKTLVEPTVPRDAFPLQWRSYLSQMSSKIEQLKAMILRAIGV
jgi:hypothetical protein